MITNIFGDPIHETEVVDVLIEGHQTEGEFVSYSDERGTLSSLRIRPSQPDIIVQHDEMYGSAVYSIDDVEEAVEVFLGYAEMHEKANLPVSSLAA